MRVILYYFYFFFLIFFTTRTTSQTFVRAETYTGLDTLEENHGVAVADYDNDLDLDVFVVAKEKDILGIAKSRSRLFRNNNDGSFTDVTEISGLTDLLKREKDLEVNIRGLDGFKFGVFWGDYDNDGFLDLFFTHYEKIQLFRNRGDGTFIDVTKASGLLEHNGCLNMGASWLDYNNDSFLDLFICSWDFCDNNILYKNNGDGTFTDVSISSGITAIETPVSYSVIPFDFNDDGWQDVYVVNDAEHDNNLFININGESFIEQANTYGLSSRDIGNDMGIDISDYDNDGDFDFFISSINDNGLLENNGNNFFSNISSEKLVKQTGWAWGSNFFDFDLDGDEDLFVVNGFLFQGAQQNTFFLNQTIEGSNTFFEQSLGLNEMTMSTQATDFDYDNDGDLDIFVSNADRPSFFYENTSLEINNLITLNWLKVLLEGTVSNRDAIGTTLTLITNKGTFKQYYTGLGFMSQSLKPVHFGLGEIDQIEELQIKWPSGIIESFHNLNTNITIKLIEGKGYEVLNIPPSEKIIGCIDPNSCSYNPNATKSDNNCEYIIPKEIQGTTTSSLNNIETYNYDLASGSRAIWNVEGGHIIDGQGTGEVKIKWELNEEGQITLVEENNGCISEKQELKVVLNLNNVSKEVSIARIWNEALLEAIRNDFARPTIHARNLFHASIALYDIWAIFNEKAKPYLIGNTQNGFVSNFAGFTTDEPVDKALKRAISYALYRLLNHRFKLSPGAENSLKRFDLIMDQFGYDTNFESTNYASGNSSALGNFIAKTIIDYGKIDGSNESLLYASNHYSPVNPPLKLTSRENETGILYPNRWQPLSFGTFIDQSGNEITSSTPNFLGPEWGNVYPFALSQEEKTTKEREEGAYNIYNDPGSPPMLDIVNNSVVSDLYKWNFSLVSIWSSHLDPSDGIMWDISPKSIGNIDISSIPNSFSDYKLFYKAFEGGDISKGHSVNPKTGKAYKTQMVPRADYARVLAEFWADGPNSETPPGHWFTILNYVNDHPLFQRRFNGEGNELSPLEWDVKSYFIMGGALHDAAISAWSIKGWYDYIRPISAIRYMAELGQSSNESLPNYHIGGLHLIEGYIEQVKEGDILAGVHNENIGKIKLKAWKGHSFISNATTDVAGVDWILAENWWPYQRPSFVTPPFAGYVSGHSTFSRAAAEVMTLITGDEFFPGGVGEFVAKKDEFLVFEKGPSVDIKLQWATYRDASDQTSLSRIWGGIHPPVDDLPGRLIGEKIGVDAYNYAINYFKEIKENNDNKPNIILYPNPVTDHEIFITNTNPSDIILVYDLQGRLIKVQREFDNDTNISTIKFPLKITSGLYLVKIEDISNIISIKN